MIIAVLKETADYERRVALTPPAAQKLTADGTKIKMEKGAGKAAGFADKEYENAGVEIAEDAAAALKGASLLFKIRAPSAEETKRLPDGLTVIADFRTFVPDWELIKNRRFSLFALERIPRISRAQDMDILSSQDNLAGYKAAIEAVNMLNRAVPMMTTAAGSVMPAKILVVGIGVAGLQAIATAKRLGAVVFAHDIRPETREQAESLGARFVEPERLNETIAEADVVITAAGSPPRAPILFKQKEIDLLKAGSVLIDVSGNVEGPGSPETFTTENGAVVTVDRQMASLLPDTASRLFANNLCNFFRLLGSGPAAGQTPDFADDVINRTCICWQGEKRE